MRPARMLLGTALALALTWPARGDTAPTPALVQTDGAEVRCKPGTEPAVYVTQVLKRGDAVEVVEQLPGGWLKIVPPKGSYSWVNTRFLRAPAPPATQPVWVVVIDKDAQVPVLVGSPLKSGKPDVVGTQLTRGTQVTAVGDPRAAEDGDGLWLPVMAPPGEYRYVRARDVDLTPPGPGITATTTTAHPGSATALVAQGAGPSAPAGTPDAARPPEVRVGAPVTAADTDPLLQQAEQRERAGDRTEAARLYDQLGNKYYHTRSDVAQQCYSRAAWLRSEVRPAAPATEGDALYAQARQYEQADNWSEAARVYNRLGDLYRAGDYTLSMQYYNRAAWLRQNHPAPRVSSAALDRVPPVGGAPVTAVSVQMAGPGRLMRSATWIDGRPTYVLESPQAQVLAYLAPQAGVDLERWVGQNIEVLGQFVPRADVRGPYMTVARVRPLSAP